MEAIKSMVISVSMASAPSFGEERFVVVQWDESAKCTARVLVEKCGTAFPKNRKRTSIPIKAKHYNSDMCTRN